MTIAVTTSSSFPRVQITIAMIGKKRNQSMVYKIVRR